jgi:hypothetical protein
MNWTKGNTEWLKSVECVNTKKGIYYINIAPAEYHDEEDEASNVRYVNFRIDHLPSTKELKDLLILVQKTYDASDEVNGFFTEKGVEWLDKSTRLGLTNSLNIQKEEGDEVSTLWLSGTPYTVNIEATLQFLKALELYAIECNNVTQRHLAEIEALTDRDAILNYDVTKGYPDRISFS